MLDTKSKSDLVTDLRYALDVMEEYSHLGLDDEAASKLREILVRQIEDTRGIFVDPRHRWGAGKSTTETQSEFLPHCRIRTGRRRRRLCDRSPNPAAERRDIHLPCGALNTEGPKTKIPAHSHKRRAR